MRVYIPSMDEFFDWMDAAGYRYAVLRGFLDYADTGYPAHDGKGDVDILVDDAALAPLRARYGAYQQQQGGKCDIRTVSGIERALEGQGEKPSYYPQPLAEGVLSSRRRWKERFYVPGAHMHLMSLIYHICYQKKEKNSKIHIDDPTKSIGSKYCRELDMLTSELGVELPYTLMDFHRYLQKNGYAAPYDHVLHYLRQEYSKSFKSPFLGRVSAEFPGEMNLFVIRHAAIKAKKHIQLILALRKHYKVVAVKYIPFMTRATQSRKMRGNKWQRSRGGKPFIAVAVFDPFPIAPSAEKRLKQPHVSNARQFIKEDLRKQFAEETGLKLSRNPMHSTDNEAEALAHLHLFFSKEEHTKLLDKVARLRQKMMAEDHPEKKALC